MQSKVRSPIVMLMIIMAIVMGIGGFAFISLLLNRPSTPEGTTPVMVNGVEVMVSLNPDRTVDTVGPGVVAPPAQEQPVQPEPTAVPPPADVAQATPVPTEPPPPTAPPVVPTATPAPDKIIRIDYLVQANDSLYSVASRLDTSIALMSEYGIAADDLVPGTTVSLPVGNPQYCPGRRPYAVKEGDTAFSIGQRVGITAADLQAINGLDANFTVRVADILCVP